MEARLIEQQQPYTEPKTWKPTPCESWAMLSQKILQWQIFIACWLEECGRLMLQRWKHNHCVHCIHILSTSNYVPKCSKIWYRIDLKNSQPDNPPGYVSIPGFLITSKKDPAPQKVLCRVWTSGKAPKRWKKTQRRRLWFFQIDKWNWYTGVQVRWYMMAQLLWNLVLALYEP